MTSTNKRNMFAIIFFVNLLWLNTAVAQGSPFEIKVSPPNRIIYEPFSGLPGFEELTVNLVLSNAARENESGMADRHNGRFLQLRLRSEDNSEFTVISSGLNKLPISLESVGKRRDFSKVNNEYRQDFTVNGARLRELEFNFTVSVAESIYADADIYSLPIVVELVDAITEQILAESLVTLEVKVGIKLQANVAGADARPGERIRVPVVDFGILKRGDSKRVSLQVRANTPAKIIVKSENKGRLRHQEHKSLYVNYRVNVDGVASSLKKPLVLFREIAKSIEGSAYPMDIIIGDVTGSFAGSYRDVIIVEVRPL